MTMETSVMEILSTAYILGIWSQAYKDNPIYKICLAALVGTTLGHQVLIALTGSWRVVFSPFAAGEWIYIIPIVWGLLHYFFFSATYMQIYRSALVLWFAVKLGTIFPGNIDRVYVLVTGWTDMLTRQAPLDQQIGLIVNLVLAAVVLLYFTYWNRLDRAMPPLFWRGLRTLGLLLFSCFFGYIVAYFFIGRSLQLGAVEAAVHMLETNGVYVLAAAALLIIVDALIGFRRILGLQPARTTVAET